MRVKHHLVVAVVAVVALAGFGASAPLAGAQEVESAYVIANPDSGLVLDVRHDVEVFLGEPDNSESQRWVLIDRGQGQFTARNVASGRCLDVPDGSLRPKVSLRVWECHSGSSQGWSLRAVSDTTAVVQSSLSDLTVAIPHWAKGAGSRVIQDTFTGDEAQHWGFIPVAAGTPRTALASEQTNQEQPGDSESSLNDYIVRTFYDVRDFWDETTGTSSSAGFLLFSTDIYENSCLGPVYEVAYCSTDDSIFMNRASAERWADDHGDFTLATIIAHEYGHNMQEEIGGVDRGPNRELQADCFAGAWAADANRRGWARAGDFQRTLQFFASIGGPGHGSGDQRRDAVLLGWMNGPEICQTYWR